MRTNVPRKVVPWLDFLEGYGWSIRWMIFQLLFLAYVCLALLQMKLARRKSSMLFSWRTSQNARGTQDPPTRPGFSPKG